MTEKQPCEKWQEMRETMYSLEEIRKHIGYAESNPPEYVPASALTALVKIAYNEMIENRIAHDRKSRGLK